MCAILERILGFYVMLEWSIGLFAIFECSLWLYVSSMEQWGLRTNLLKPFYISVLMLMLHIEDICHQYFNIFQTLNKLPQLNYIQKAALIQ